MPALDTPALVLDLDRVRVNVDRMAARVRAQGVALRPHAKTHKCVDVARLQLAAGAAGLTVATLSEAEVFAEAGCTDLFVAYPVYPHGAKADRLRRLLDGAALTVGVDNAEGAAALAAAAGGRRVRVLLEVDSGQHRTGLPAGQVVALARACRAHGLSVEGVFTHGGHAYAGAGAPAAAAVDEGAALDEAAHRLRGAGFDVRTVSAGSTPTTGAVRPATVTEERPGTYVFGDRQQVALGACSPGDVAALVAATVVSSGPERFVLDAGSKALASDRPAWLPGHGSIPALGDAVVSRISEHHGVVDRTDADWEPPAVGEVVLVAPNHACTVVNLFDQYLVTEGGRVVDTWRVSARGRNG